MSGFFALENSEVSTSASSSARAAFCTPDMNADGAAPALASTTFLASTTKLIARAAT